VTRDAIRSFTLYRLELPLGRTIGDNDCSYDSISAVALRLCTDSGLEAWGYGDAVSKATFTRPAWYLQPLPALTALRSRFLAEWWPRLEGTVPGGSNLTGQPNAHPLGQAVDLALWDLRGKATGAPVWSLLAPGAEPRPVRAYGSLLDFPLDDDAACELALGFVARGFDALKVKVGGPDPARDVRRLAAVRAAVGPDVELAVDANEGWTWRRAADQLRRFDNAGINISYLEDALPHRDLIGYERLARVTAVPLVAHDYVSTVAEADALLASGAIERLRVGAGGIDGMLAFAAAARAHRRRIIVGNTLLEHGVHVALALDGVDRIEFSDLAWNNLAETPMRFERGLAVPPDAPGLGLRPRAEMLAAFSAESA
jgi:L-alanine-DL-glutamate epimerase-like enolase superfamily enzyme